MSRETLVGIALGVLEEAQDSCLHQPVELSRGLRFAVAFLYAMSDDRSFPGDTPWQAFEDFLAAVSNPKVTEIPEREGGLRSATSLATLNHIKRRVGRLP